MILVVEVVLVEVDKVLYGVLHRVRIEVHHGVEDALDAGGVGLVVADGDGEGVIEGGSHGPWSLAGCAKEVTEAVVGVGR